MYGKGGVEEVQMVAMGLGKNLMTLSQRLG